MCPRATRRIAAKRNKNAAFTSYSRGVSKGELDAAFVAASSGRPRTPADVRLKTLAAKIAPHRRRPAHLDRCRAFLASLRPAPFRVPVPHWVIELRHPPKTATLTSRIRFAGSASIFQARVSPGRPVFATPAARADGTSPERLSLPGPPLYFACEFAHSSSRIDAA